MNAAVLGLLLALLLFAVAAVVDGTVQTAGAYLDVRHRTRPRVAVRGLLRRGRHRLRRPWPRWLQWLPRRR